MNTKYTNRLFTLLLCICFVLLVITTNISLCFNAGHTHDANGIGGCCTMCANTASLEEIIKNLINGCLAVLAFLSLLVLISCFSLRTIYCFGFTSPVYLKVRLNN